ncbi:methyl-accepting chemotaxis protein [Rhodovulum euryhalinum]|uniref:Methyl-accepting chemotaxis protein n=1 Tax=Rhodovulum euryhalinum TaxID=35805 RepID=A0A4R2KHM0_9RHOB|nr:methyl-accepting chemotaxis protein [Rhodovulum euryhalinum]TCO73321.1 methyl-accepting chemotaxis protein [Rhodovulum euryhalinum]
MKLRTKIVLAITLSVVMSALLVLVPMLIGMQGLIEKGTERELEHLDKRFHAALESRLQGALTTASLIAEMPAVQQAMASGDRATLHELFVPGFARMRSEYGIRQFQFHEPPATSFFRVHKPDQFGDDLSGFRQTVIEANARKAPIAGLERGRGGLGIRGISPVAHQGRHLGTVEIGLDLDAAFIRDLVAESDALIEFYVLPDKSIDNFSSEDSAVTRSAASFEGDPALESQAILAAGDTGIGMVSREVGGTSYASAAFPVTDFAGTTVALLHVMVPRSAYLAIAGQMRLIAFGAAAAALIAGLTAAVIFGTRLAGTLTDLVEKMGRLADGELDVRFSRRTRQGGEVGKLQDGLVTFRDKVIAEFKRREEDANQNAAHQKAVVEVLGDGLRQMAQGDLTGRIDQNLGAHYNGLRDDYNETVRSLGEVLCAISDAATRIDERARSINVAAHDLSQRTENSAATLEETAAALHDLTSSVHATATGARDADEIGSETIGKARTGAHIVADTVVAMTEINSSADEISRIIHVIDDISFQTNLLALNAGVEAARAGEAGRGFAVVASEVRALAQRTTDAAQEIGLLIASSGDKVKQGVGLVDQTGQALNEIVRAVEAVTAKVSQIATLAGEQAVGVGEINIAVGQLDQVTQQNAAMFEETTAASDTLQLEGQTLRELVSRFRYRSDTAGDFAVRPMVA